MVYSCVFLGIENLARSNLKLLYNQRIGVCANIASCTYNLQPTVDFLLAHPRIDLKVIFAPEHGLYGALQDQVKSSSYFDNARNICVASLYGKQLEPKAEILESIDTLVIDVQDVGSRYYTFVWSALILTRAMARFKKRVIILDRPNPLNGTTVAGPVLDPEFTSFVGLYALPIRHGMTLGELICMFNRELNIGVDLDVVPMKGWKRHWYYDDTGMFWSMPSPNMPSLNTALVYPGMCLFEGTNISEGRGTTRPFEIIGAPWIDPRALVKKLQRLRLSGVKFRPLYFIPTFSKYARQVCGGLQLYITHRNKFDSITTALEIIRLCKKMYPGDFKWRQPPYEFEKTKLPFDILSGNSWIRDMIERSTPVSSIKKRWTHGKQSFQRTRKKYLMYD